MNQEKCEYCNSATLANVKGELICTTCGLVNKSALENKDRYISPTFYKKRKLGREKDDKEKKSFLTRINSDIAIIGSYLELSVALQKEATNIILEIIMKERKVYPTFPWNTKTPKWSYNCLIALSVLSVIKNNPEVNKHNSRLYAFFKDRRGEITSNDINNFIENLTSEYSFIIKNSET
ncbi:MAG: hypothetical protein ACTSO7_16525 [Candidatus Heimdallarchaeota archaeon]